MRLWNFLQRPISAAIQAKNERRMNSIAGMEAEIEDEKQARKNGYQDDKSI